MNNYSMLKNTDNNHYVPTIEINQKIAGKRNLILSIAGLFLFLEFIGFSFLYLFLFQFRIAHENLVPLNLWDWHSAAFYKYLIFYLVSSFVYVLFIYRYHIYRFQSDMGFADELYKVAKSFSFAIL